MSENKKTRASGSWHSTIIGNLGKDPVTKSFSTKTGEVDITYLRVATTPFVGGEKEPITHWINVKCMGPGQKLAAMLQKGDTVSVRGNMAAKIRKTEDNSDGYLDLDLDLDRSYNALCPLGGKRNDSNGSYQASSSNSSDSSPSTISEDDIPF